MRVEEALAIWVWGCFMMWPSPWVCDEHLGTGTQSVLWARSLPVPQWSMLGHAS